MVNTDLNPAQRQAVIHTEGPLLILAGAGSGKTKTLTHRIAHIITEQGVWPSQILAVTFTNKAAREMRERLGVILGSDTSTRDFMPWMGTFHSICVRILRIDGMAINIPPNWHPAKIGGIECRAPRPIQCTEVTLRNLLQAHQPEA